MDDFDDILKEKPTTKSGKFGKAEKKKAITSIIIMLVVTYLIWDYRTLAPIHLGFLSLLIYPIKMFTVFLHEISHGLMATLNGGHITSIALDPRLGGVCYFTMPKSWIGSTLTASAGYLGSIFWGCVILYCSIRKNWDKSINTFISHIYYFFHLFRQFLITFFDIFIFYFKFTNKYG